MKYTHMMLSHQNQQRRESRNYHEINYDSKDWRHVRAQWLRKIQSRAKSAKMISWNSYNQHAKGTSGGTSPKNIKGAKHPITINAPSQTTVTLCRYDGGSIHDEFTTMSKLPWKISPKEVQKNTQSKCNHSASTIHISPRQHNRVKVRWTRRQ